MKRLLRAVCLALCWTLLMAGMPGKASAEEAAPMVRVLLRRLQLTDRADLTLAGAYTVRVGGEDLMALPENAQVTVQIRSGALYLFYDGMSMRLGKSAEFRRNQSGSAMPGLRFEKNGNLYPGSLTLTVENGTLVPILSLSVEDYLLGVVPYEMSDSFPLEALKAPKEDPIEPFKPNVVFDDFEKCDFRVCRVLKCEAVKKSQKLLRFELDDGSGTTRQILSGIAMHYKPEELVGKTVAAIVNLPPRKMMGLESCGMLLSAVRMVNGKEELHLVMLDDSIPTGSVLC